MQALLKRDTDIGLYLLFQLAANSPVGYSASHALVCAVLAHLIARRAADRPQDERDSHGACRADDEHRHDGAAGRTGQPARKTQPGTAGRHPRPHGAGAHRCWSSWASPTHCGWTSSATTMTRSPTTRPLASLTPVAAAGAHRAHRRPLRRHDQSAQVTRRAQRDRLGALHHPGQRRAFGRDRPRAWSARSACARRAPSCGWTTKKWPS